MLLQVSVSMCRFPCDSSLCTEDFVSRLQKSLAGQTIPQNSNQVKSTKSRLENSYSFGITHDIIIR